MAEPSPKQSTAFAAGEYAHGRARLTTEFAAWRDVQEQKASMPLLELEQLDPGPMIASLLDEKHPALFVGADSAQVRLSEWAPPHDELSPEFIGDAFEVSSEEQFESGTLVIRAHSDAFGRAAPETARVFRHEPKTGAFILCPPSGLGTTGNYLWARIGFPGLYGAIGLNSDPLFLSALEILAITRPLVLDEAPESRRELLNGVVEALLRIPVAERWTEGTAAELTREPGRRELPIRLFDDERKPVSTDELRSLVERASTDHEPPELQLLRLLQGVAPA